MSEGMTLRRLVHEATYDFTHMDEPVYVWAYNAAGDYVRHVVTDLTTDQRTGMPRQEFTIEERPE